MPSSMIFVGLVVVWLLILVPAVARHRQEVARPSTAALSGRVLERARPRRDPEPGRELEVDVMERVDHARPAAADDRWDVGLDQDAADGSGAGPDLYDHDEHNDHGGQDDRDERGWERPSRRYRPGRGGFDPQAAALAARARYRFRQRVVLTLLVLAVGTAVVAVFVLPGIWWLHAAVDVTLVGYLAYLRRQVRMEESIRERRAGRLAGARRPSGGDRPTRAPDDADGVGGTRSDLGDRDRRDDGDEHEALDDVHADRGRDSGGDLDDVAADRDRPERAADQRDDERAIPSDDAEQPEPAERGPALPRLQPAPPPPLPAGTSLVEVDEADPELHDLDGPSRRDYRRAAGE